MNIMQNKQYFFHVQELYPLKTGKIIPRLKNGIGAFRNVYDDSRDT